VATPAPRPWSDFAAEAPTLAAAVGARLEAHRHHGLATLRADGAPRVWGTEVRIVDGRLQFGAMPGTRRADDLRRDPRCALHANPGDGSMEGGDAKLTGRAHLVTDVELRARFVAAADGDPNAPFDLFVVDLATVTLTSVHPDGDRLVLHCWDAGSGERTVDRH
jgi:hypothetical protein